MNFPIKTQVVVAYEKPSGKKRSERGIVIKIQAIKKSGDGGYPPIKLLITN